MKRTISILLAVVISLSSFVTVFAQPRGSMANFKKTKIFDENQFTDVSSSAWFFESVKTAYELGLVSGTGENTFSPDANITLAETITLASRIHSTYMGNTPDFSGGSPWYQSYVDYAIENGIIASDEYPDYKAYATRAQFATIFAASLPSEALLEINFIESKAIPDVSPRDNFAVIKLYRAGILTGNDEKGTFAPNTNIQRSAVATIVSRMAIEEMRVTLHLEAEKPKFATAGHIELAEYNGELYSFDGPWDVRFSVKDYEPYDYASDSFEMIFGSLKYRDLNDNPFVAGELAYSVEPWEEDSWSIISEAAGPKCYMKYSEEYIGPTTTLTVFTIEYDGKKFESITAEEYLEAGLEDGDSGVWNGVRYCVDNYSSWAYICYNLNDLAQFFGITDRYFKIDDSGENRCWVITEE